jgi:hypothetical protein
VSITRCGENTTRDAAHNSSAVATRQQRANWFAGHSVARRAACAAILLAAGAFSGSVSAQGATTKNEPDARTQQHIQGPERIEIERVQPGDAMAEVRLPPEPETAMRLYRAIEPWVRSMNVPTQPDENATVPAAACVTLRVGGRVVARGVDERDDGGALQRAVRVAVSQARAAYPVKADALEAESLAAIGKTLMIELELAGEFVPMRPRTYFDADLDVPAGIEGVAVRVGDSLRAAFPSYTRQMNQLAGDTLGVVFAAAAGQPALGLRNTKESQPGEAGPKLGATFYRFRVTHLAQPSASEPPVFFYRGGRLVPESAITTDECRRWAAGLTGSLAGWSWIERETRRARDAAKADSGATASNRGGASVRDALLVALALERASRSVVLRPAARERARAEAAAIIAEMRLLVMPETEQGAVDVAALSLWLGVSASLYSHAAAEESKEPSRDPGAKHDDAPAAAPSRTDIAEAWSVLARMFDPNTGWSESAPVGVRGLAAWGLTSWGMTASTESRRIAESATRRVYIDTPRGQLVSHMPWLGWAESMIAARSDAAAPAGTTEALREMRASAWKFQMDAASAGSDGRDFVGGIVFPGSTSPAPSAQSARPLAFIASMLGSERFTETAELPRETVRLLRGLRFLRQLTIDESAAYALSDAAADMWSVRLSPLDQRHSPEATAMTLLTVLESLESLDNVGKRLTPTEKPGR